MSCSTTTSECCPASDRNSSAVRSVSSSVMPATGSSSSSSLRLLHQQHADLQPLLLAVREQPGGALRAVLRGGSASSISPIRSRCSPRRAANSSDARTPLVGLQRELEVLEHACAARTPSASGTCGRCRRARSRLSRRRSRSIVWPKNARAGVGPGLAGDDVHHRRLAGAVGADDAAQLAGVDRQRQRVQRLEAVEADADVFQVQDRAVRDVELAGGRATRPPPRGRRAAVAASRRSRMASARTRRPPSVGRHARAPCASDRTQADDAVAAGTASPAMNSAPRKYSQNSGNATREPALRAVDEDGADDRRRPACRGRRPPPRSRSRSSSPATSRSG